MASAVALRAMADRGRARFDGPILPQLVTGTPAKFPFPCYIRVYNRHTSFEESRLHLFGADRRVRHPGIDHRPLWRSFAGGAHPVCGHWRFLFHRRRRYHGTSLARCAREASDTGGFTREAGGQSVADRLDHSASHR